MQRTHRQAAVAQLAQQFADAALMQIDGKLQGDLVAQVGATKAHHSVLGKIGAMLHPGGELFQFSLRQAGGTPAARPIG
jgi:hypothetical protein